MKSGPGDADTYLMESPDESARLEAKTDPAQTDRLLALTGLARGSIALDAGAGTGAVARRMARWVGQSGSVTAVDRSQERLDWGARAARAEGLDNLRFAEADLSAGSIPGGPYDFVWCRFVFEYLGDPDAALGHLIAATRVGGTIVVADTDGHAAFHHPLPPELGAGLERVFAALEGRFDPYAGRKLFARFRRLGLQSIRVHVEPYHVYAGPVPAPDLANWIQKLRTIAPICAPAFGGTAAYQHWSDAFLAHLQSPDTFSYSALVIVQGVRAR